MKLCVCLLLLFWAATLAESRKGGWGWPPKHKPIKDLKDPHVIEIAKFAVNEYNKNSKADLKLVRVVNGTMVDIYGMFYELVLEVKGGDRKRYKAVVGEKKDVKKLKMFEPVHA